MTGAPTPLLHGQAVADELNARDIGVYFPAVFGVGDGRGNESPADPLTIYVVDANLDCLLLKRSVWDALQGDITDVASYPGDDSYRAGLTRVRDGLNALVRCIDEALELNARLP